MNFQNKISKEVPSKKISWLESPIWGPDPVEVNETIHDFIEEASSKCKKVVWRLSPLAANALERDYFLHGEVYLQRLICLAVGHSEAKTLRMQDIDFARYSIKKSSNS